MSPIAVPMVPHGGRVLVAEWWEVVCTWRGERTFPFEYGHYRYGTRDQASDEGKRMVKECKRLKTVDGFNIVHVRRYKLNGKVKK